MNERYFLCTLWISLNFKVGVGVAMLSSSEKKLYLSSSLLISVRESFCRCEFSCNCELVRKFFDTASRTRPHKCQGSCFICPPAFLLRCCVRLSRQNVQPSALTSSSSWRIPRSNKFLSHSFRSFSLDLFTFNSPNQLIVGRLDRRGDSKQDSLCGAIDSKQAQ